MAEGDEEGAGQGVVDEAEMDGGVAGLTCGVEVEGAELMADADGGGGANAEHDHIGEVRHVLRDLMAGLRCGTEPTDHDGRERKG